ncbi:hypothetical protein MHK_004818, partial [Candidatus Magnetomorum sp. HK-1]
MIAQDLKSKREDYKMAKKKIKKIPYGTADFERIQTKNMYYKDDLWHHVAYVNKASGSFLYVDGIAVNTSDNPCSNLNDYKNIGLTDALYMLR